MDLMVSRNNDGVAASEKRIEWVDIYKGIAICLMVIGHVTGQFNQYIYQFHMAAFFFVSGFTRRTGKSIVRTLWDKAYSLLVPYVSTFFLFIFTDSILNRFNLRDYFFTEDMGYIGIANSCRELFLNGNCYAWLLGAGWFVSVLFSVEVIHAFLVKLCINNLGIYSIFIIVLYRMGYICVDNSWELGFGLFSNDLAFIGLLFFGTGYVAGQSDFFGKLFAKKWVYFCVLPVVIVILYYFGNVRLINVNYPTRSFSAPVLEFLAGINGVLLIYMVAQIFSKVSVVNKIMSYLGRNTLGILFFHFVFFKVAYLFLFVLHVVPFDFLRNFLPTEEIAQKWWWLIAFISIINCLVFWRFLTVVKGVRWCFGVERKKWEKTYEFLAEKSQKSKVLFPQISIDLVVNKLIKEFAKPQFLGLVIVIIMICVPLLNQGIMCNDELQYYFWSRQGFGVAYNHFRSMWIDQGRFMASIFTPIWMWLSVLGEEMYIFRIIPVASILVNVTLFCSLINKLLHNKKFSCFCGICIMAFLPITFAPMSPNAYTTTFGIPFSFLLGALIIYIKYLEEQNSKLLVLVSLFMLIAFSSYEIFITYVPLFCIIALWKRGIKNIRGVITASIVPVLTGVGYLILYVVCRIIMPSNYGGNSIGFTMRGAVEILLYLFKMSFPGSFLSNPTYEYLNSIYQKVQFVDCVRIGIVGIGVLLITLKLIEGNRSRGVKRVGFGDLGVVTVAVVYAILPALPLAISSMYQNNIGENRGFIALPTTYFTYFAACFLCCYILWIVLQQCKRDVVTVILFLLISIVCVPIQYQNSNFSNIQNEHYSKLGDIENFLCTNFILSKGGAKIYSVDIFETRISLGVHGSYWEDNFRRLGSDIEVICGYPEEVLSSNMFFLAYEDDDFILEGSESVVVASREYIQEKNIELLSGEVFKAQLEMIVFENGYYFYNVKEE